MNACYLCLMFFMDLKHGFNINYNVWIFSRICEYIYIFCRDKFIFSKILHIFTSCKHCIGFYISQSTYMFFLSKFLKFRNICLWFMNLINGLLNFALKRWKNRIFQIHFKTGHNDILNGFKSSSVKMSDFEVWGEKNFKLVFFLFQKTKVIPSGP